MKEKYLINARIIDPKNDLDEIGGLIIDSKGLIKAVGKKVANGNIPSSANKIDLKKQVLISIISIYINIIKCKITSINCIKFTSNV